VRRLHRPCRRVRNALVLGAVERGRRRKITTIEGLAQSGVLQQGAAGWLGK